MRSGSANSATAIFAALIAAIAGFIAWMAYLEPTLHDVWHFRFYANTKSVPEYVAYMYFEFDARLGNLIAYFVCGSLVAHVVWAPLIVLAYLLALFALAFGRLPRPSELADSARLLLVFALFWIAVPWVGYMTFYRPFAVMYLHAFAILAWLVVIPYRFALASGAPSRAGWRTPAMFVAGLVGGFTNEHVVPTAIVAIVACLWWMRRRGVRWAPWMLTGLAGLTLGFVLLFFAPAQDLRYEGLAQQATIPERILDRGLLGNLALLGELLGYAKWMVLTIVAAGALHVARTRGQPRPADLRARLGEAGLAVAAALTIYVTTLASPLQGFRLMFASNTMLIVAGLVVLDVLARDRAVRAALTAVAAVIVVAHCVHVARLYLTVHDEYMARRAAIAATPPGAWVKLPMYTHWRASKWGYGDDFRHDRRRRKLVRRYTHLRGAEMVYPPGAR